MARVPTAYKKIFLRGIFWSCEKTKLSLDDSLKQYAAKAVESSASDVVLTGTAANGASVNYAVSSAGIPSAARAELIEELIELYAAAKAAYPDYDDERLAGAMLAALKPRRTSAVNFGGLVK